MDKLLKMKGHEEQLDILFKKYLKELNDCNYPAAAEIY